MSLKTYTIAEIGHITNLAPHTLRYYEQQFPHLLKTERSKGGHRIYNQSHLETIKSIIHLLKDEGKSIKQAREILGEPENSIEESVNDPKKFALKVVPPEQEKPLFNIPKLDISSLLILVVEKLDYICKNNDNRDKMLMRLLKSKSKEKKNELLEQLARTRRENHETLSCVRQFLNRNIH